MTQRNPPGVYGQSTIGYGTKQYRYDENFYSGGPPVWPKHRLKFGGYEMNTAMVVPDYDRWRTLRTTYGIAADPAH
jgi:hypothetical protein